MVDKTLYHTTRLIIIFIIHLLLYVIEIIKQSHAIRGERFESSLLTWPGEPNTHVRGTTSPIQPFPFLSSPWIRVTLPDYRVRRLCTHTSRQKINPTSTKRVNDCSTNRSNQVLGLTDYHILGMWLVLSKA